MNKPVMETGKSSLKSRKRSSVVRKCLFPGEFTIYTPQGEAVPFPCRCSICWNCLETKVDDLVGRMASHIIGCAHAELWTLTYDDKRGAEERLSARHRWTPDIQHWKKVIRQREKRGLDTYNRRETRAAEAEGRKPVLVDAARSYVKFLDVYEMGSKGTKRSHWHVMVLWESHFPVEDAIYRSNDIRVGLRAAKRVWDLHKICAPEARYRRDTEADNPEVIDFRVKSDANQEHGSWPHGQVNVQSMTHHVQSEEVTLKPDAGIEEGVRYITKYVHKNNQTPPWLHWDQKKWSQDDFNSYRAQYRKNVHRTMSRGIGFPYARAYGREHGRHGIPMDKLLYSINQMRSKRSVKSRYLRENKLEKLGFDPVTAQSMIDDLTVYQMQGVCRREAFAGWYEVADLKYKKEEIEGRLGEDQIRYIYERETQACADFLKSRDAEVLRSLQTQTAKQIKPLKDQLTPVHCYAKDEKGELLNKGRRDQIKFRKAKERLEERRAEIAEIYQHYEIEAKKEDKQKRLLKVKHHISYTPLDEMLTEEAYKNRPKHEREMFRREVDAIHIEELQQQLKEEGDQELIDLLEKRLVVAERAAFKLPRHDLVHPWCTSKTLWRWVNTSDDFRFPDIREELIRRYCEVEYLDNDARLVKTPNGRRLMQRLAMMPGSRRAFDPEANRFIRHKGYMAWTSVALRREEEPHNTKIVTALDSRDPIFTGPEPLKLPEGFIVTGKVGEQSRTRTHKKPERREGDMGTKTLSVSTAKRDRPTLVELDREYRLSKSRNKGPVEGADYALWHAYRHCRPKGCNAVLQAALDAKCIDNVYGFYL